jgi:hypothetical protein
VSSVARVEARAARAGTGILCSCRVACSAASTATATATTTATTATTAATTVNS